MRTVSAIVAGRGPTEGFVPYVKRAIANLAADEVRHSARQVPTEDLEPILPAELSADRSEEFFDREVALIAFTALPKAWRKVLWQVEVDGLHPREIADLEYIGSNTVSARLYRAKKALRRGNLKAHVRQPQTAGCAKIYGSLADYVSGELKPKQTEIVEQYLVSCSDCAEIVAELRSHPETPSRLWDCAGLGWCHLRRDLCQYRWKSPVNDGCIFDRKNWRCSGFGSCPDHRCAVGGGDDIFDP